MHIYKIQLTFAPTLNYKHTILMRNFTFSLKWHTILENYPVEIRREVFDAVITYAATGKIIEMQPLARMAFDFIRHEIDERAKARERRAARVAKKAESSQPLKAAEDLKYTNTSLEDKVSLEPEIPEEPKAIDAPAPHIVPEPKKKATPKIPDYLAARAEKQKPFSKTVNLKGVKIKLVKPSCKLRSHRKICA